jgi:arginase
MADARTRPVREDVGVTRYLVVPQWQGSPSSRAMQLIDGAMAIAGDLPRGATTILEVPMEAGEALGTGIHRLSSLQRIRDQIAAALEGHDEPVLTVGGDCGVALAPIAHVAARTSTLAVVWLDAHPDLHTPDDSPSGAFSGMVLRAVLGDGDPGLRLAPGAVDPARVVLAAAREYDDAEVTSVDGLGIRSLSVADLGDPGALAAAVAQTGAEAVYIHIDIDALDPAEVAGNAHPAPFGVSVAEVTAAIAAVRAAVPLAGSSIAGYSPASATHAHDDLGAILRLVGSLA